MKVSVQMPNVDAEGYLVEPQDWSEELANELARQENISLSEEHWIVIRFMREYFDNHQVIPDARFPYGYVKQACKIAGMKRPRAWSTG
jgi:TusE/DsrC/DsvC family sulfur relay protein